LGLLWGTHRPAELRAGSFQIASGSHFPHVRPNEPSSRPWLRSQFYTGNVQVSATDPFASVG
jgi:hypothetical protein